MNRRQFLVVGAGLAVAAGCGTKRSGDDAVARVSDPSGTTAPAGLNLVVASYYHVAGIDERLTLALIDDEQSGPVPLTEPLQVTLDGQPVESEIHSDGIPLPYALIRHRFAAPGKVKVRVTYKGLKGEVDDLEILDGQSLKVPYPGKPMISAPSPTTADSIGVEDVCTAEPPCPLHDVSLDAALAEKRPLAVLFSTPARCQSRLCGPVLDTVLAQRETFGDKVRFLHVEIYKTRTSLDLAPTVAAYALTSEPVLFLAGADGIVRERLDNAIDRVEAKAALDRLVAG